ncbi:MAG: extracellular solute-binding protein [Pseudomonadota bacterium]
MLGFNPAVVKDRPTGWADLWRPDFAGKLSFASPVHSQMPALVIIAAELAGGSAANVDPGFKKLAELRPVKLSVAYTDWVALNKTGEVILSTEFDYYMNTMKDQGYAIDYVVPQDKGIGCLDYASIVKGTQQPEIAEVFLDLLISTKVQEAFCRRELPRADQQDGAAERGGGGALRVRGPRRAAALLRPGDVRRQPPRLDRAAQYGSRPPLGRAVARPGNPGARAHCRRRPEDASRR